MPQGLRRRKLERLKREGDVAKLREILADPDLERGPDGTLVDLRWERRVAAITTLAEIDHTDAEDALVAALDDPVLSVRLAAIEALAGRDTPTALPRLAYVCAGWGDSKDRARLTALRHLRRDLNRDATMRYAEGLLDAAASSPPDDLDEGTIRRFVDCDPSGELSDALARLLVGHLGAEEREKAACAESILTWLGESGTRAAQRAALEIDGAGPGAARVLGRIGEEDAIATLAELLEHAASPEDRRAAAVALADMRSPLAIEPLLAATRDRSKDVRDAALAGLDSYGTMVTVAMIGGVVRPSLTSVLRPTDDQHHVARIESAPQPDGLRRRIRGFLARP